MIGPCRGRLKELYVDELGAVVSAELVIVGTVLAIGLATGWAALQQSVVSELTDLSEAISALDQTYSYAGQLYVGCSRSCLASTAGSRYVDTQIVGDDCRPEPMSDCCLSPIIVRNATRPGHWHCDRCGHQHRPDGPGPHNPEAHRPPPPRPDHGPSARPDSPRPDSPRPESSRAPEPRRPNSREAEPRESEKRDAPPRGAAPREGSSPFTPRDTPDKSKSDSKESPRSRKPRTSETSSEAAEAAGTFMLAQYPPLQIDEPHIHGHFEGHHGVAPCDPCLPRPRYEPRGCREPISRGNGCGRSGFAGGAGWGFSYPGSIRPGFEFDSGVSRVRVLEIPLSPAVSPQYLHPDTITLHGPAPIADPHLNPMPFPIAVYPRNHHQPNFPDYVW